MPMDDNAEILQRLQQLLGRPDPTGFTRKGIAPGAFSYVTRDDRLYLRARNSVTGAVVRVSGRLHQPDGDIHEFTYLHTPGTDRSVSIEAFEIGEGYLVGLALDVETGTVRRGQCFVELGLLRGITAAASVRQVLGRDYVTNDDAWGWPGAPNKSSLHGPGVMLSITGSDPAAGAEISDAVPTNARWKPYLWRANFVADATVENRFAHLAIDDGTLILWRGDGFAAQTASQNRDYNYAAGSHHQNANAEGDLQGLLPDVQLAAGFNLLTVTTDIQAGDNWGAPQILVEEWIEE